MNTNWNVPLTPVCLRKAFVFFSVKKGRWEREWRPGVKHKNNCICTLPGERAVSKQYLCGIFVVPIKSSHLICFVVIKTAIKQVLELFIMFYEYLFNLNATGHQTLCINKLWYKCLIYIIVFKYCQYSTFL